MSEKTAPRGRSKAAKKLKNFRPPKPYKSFELTPVSGGQWAKRINGRLYYFGRWGNVKNGVMEPLPNYSWENALKLYKAQAADLHAGREPRTNASPDELTVKAMCNAFMHSKKLLLDSNEIKASTWNENRQTCVRLIDAVGGNRIVNDLTKADFEALRAKIAKQLGPVGLGGQISKIRSVFKHADRLSLVPASFKKPAAKVLREIRNEQPEKMFEANEIRELLKKSKGQMLAMILLGINCGLGNTDCSELRFSNLDLETGWLDYPRPKTQIKRRMKLWPETVDALREVIDNRAKPASKADQDIVFLTRYKVRWVREIEHHKKDEHGNQILQKVTTINSVSGEFSKVVKRCKLSGGRNFYVLRHTFETIGGESLDQVAVNHIMGHLDPSMAAVYRERINDDRLAKVAEHVHNWSYGAKGGK